MKRSTLALVLFLIGLAVFSAARLALYLFNYEYFEGLKFYEVLRAFISGVRFDAAVLALIAGPVALFILLPLGFGWWKKLWGWLLFSVLVVFVYVLIVDIFYFGLTKRHLVDELYMVGGETGFLVNTALQYKFYIVASVCLILAAGFFYARLLRRPYVPEKKLWIKIPVCILLSVLFIRGNLESKALSSIDAFNHGAVEGNLTLNGVYTTYRHKKEARSKPVEYFSLNEAIVLSGGNPDAQYPFLKEYAGREDKKNIVILIMESWTSYYIGALNGGTTDATPNFDRLAAEGALFINNFAAEKRSIDGIQAILTGIPPVETVSSLGSGLEIKSQGNLGSLASENGYETIFIQTSNRRSFYMDAVSKALGFEIYYGREDIPLVLDYPDPEAASFGWDYEGFMRLEKEISANRKPFLAVFFSGTTHTPYPKLQPPFDRFEYLGEESDSSFLNLMEYSDYSLGKFMEEASAKEWFKDTIFIITGDHTLTSRKQVDYAGSYSVPLLIYSPLNVEPAVYRHVTSHLDILPTIMELSGLEGNVSVTGRSVFDVSAPRYVYTGDKGTSGMAEGEKWVQMRGNIVVASSEPELVGKTTADADEELMKRLPAFIQAVGMLVNANRWYPVK